MNLCKLDQIVKNRKNMEEKEIKINIPEGYEIDKEKSSFEHIVFKKKEKTLPKTWEEFCINNPLKEGEAYITSVSRIITRNNVTRNREVINDKSYLPSKELAEAMLALCQLIQLRDCYNDGWKPDWAAKDDKYCISNSNNKIEKGTWYVKNIILVFKTRELCDEFCNNFKGLIEVAKPLL